MNKKSLIYGLVGFLAGSTATVVLLLTAIKTFSQAPKPTVVTGGNAKTAQVLLVENPPQTTPVPPLRGGMMGQSDRHFIIMMIPHHEGAVAMAQLAETKAKHPELKRLAQAIKTAQTQEIQDMRTWYKQWYGADVPAWEPGMGMGMGMHHNWNDQLPPNRQGNNPRSDWKPGMRMGRMSGMGMMGAMSTDLEALKNAPDFDKEFIRQMIPHHQMAVHMASMVLDSQHPELRTLGQNIIKSQTAEINQMQQWYQTW
jgi:uncharacterized protein (DUF305 family)